MVFDDFNYQEFLAKDGIYSVLFFPVIAKTEQNKGNMVYAAILQGKQRLRAVLAHNLSPPEESILAAMLLGDKSKLSVQLKEKLNLVGLRHITAISGMHVAILVAILTSLLLGIGVYRRFALLAVLLFIILFVVMTGLQPSAVRAGIMGGMFVVGQLLGRGSVSLRALVIVAAGMLLINPMLLTKDVGFQLSFLAVLGIILFLPFF